MRNLDPASTYYIDADKKGLSVVVDKNTVVYGGLDITDEVSKALQSGK